MPEFTKENFITWLKEAFEAAVPVQFVIEERFKTNEKRERAKDAFNRWMNRNCAE